MMVRKLLGNCERGRLFIVSAPAGTGKTTLVDRLTRAFPCVVRSVSYTTRGPRPKEKEGRDYCFVDRATFQKMVDAGHFLEHVELYGDYYGTSKEWVEKRIASGQHVVLVIDTQGALAIQAPAVRIFIRPPSLQELARRLRRRKTETEQAIEKRVSWAEHELLQLPHYDYQVVNEKLDVAYEVLKSIFIAEENRVCF